MGNKKLQVWLPLLFSVVLIIGMFLGYGLNSSGGKKSFFAADRRSTLQEALDFIRLKYVDTVPIDSLEGKAIEEMMAELDPHSVYLPPVDLKEANEELEGSFPGIGVEFNIFNDTVNVVYVIPGGPSEKAGLKTGDKIIKANDSTLTGKAFNTDEIKRYIRGPRGTVAKLQVLRGKQQLTFTITRGTIPVSSVEASYMFEGKTGYIRLDKFTEKSYEEFMEAMEALKKQGLQHLILDLRGNGGGFMNEAVDMADEFLEGEKLVVYMQGVNTKKREYRCKRPGLFETGKLVILVDELSASASEVLAGALQDWCRADIVGRRTFGKGLVQDQFPLSNGAALRLTIARYYTPLGRSIQRSYSKGKKVYMDEVWERFQSGEMFSLDSVRNHHNGKKYLNNCNDTLYAGDGITPDVFVPVDTSQVRQKVSKVLTTGNLNQTIYLYYLNNKQKIDQYTSAADFAKRFDAAGMWNGYVKYPGGSMAFEIIKGKEKEQVLQNLKALLARYRWRSSGYYEVINADDPVIKKALETIRK